MLRTVYLTTEPPRRAQRIRRSVHRAHDPLFAHLSPAIGKQVGAADEYGAPLTKRRTGDPLSAPGFVAPLSAN